MKPLTMLSLALVALVASYGDSALGEETSKAASAQSQRLNILLVTQGYQEHDERVAGFLREKGFDCDVIGYGKVTTELCDAHDLVIADNVYDTFKFHALANKMPQTVRPVFCTGFCGTQVLLAHDIALGGGYV